MERLRGAPVHGNIPATLEHHREAIHVTQARRKDEIVNAANPQRPGALRYNNEKGKYFPSSSSWKIFSKDLTMKINDLNYAAILLSSGKKKGCKKSKPDT